MISWFPAAQYLADIKSEMFSPNDSCNSTKEWNGTLEVLKGMCGEWMWILTFKMTAPIGLAWLGTWYLAYVMQGTKPMI